MKAVSESAQNYSQISNQTKFGYFHEGSIFMNYYETNLSSHVTRNQNLKRKFPMEIQILKFCE